jgi:hypothetical protein
MYGRNTANQKIEAHWRQLKKSFARFYINLFKDMIDESLFDNSNNFHIELIRYCFMNLIQKKLRREYKTLEHKLYPQNQ